MIVVAVYWRQQSGEYDAVKEVTKTGNHFEYVPSRYSILRLSSTYNRAPVLVVPGHVPQLIDESTLKPAL